jgi:hypothetical protein
MEDGSGVAKAGRIFSGIVSLIPEAVSYQAARSKASAASDANPNRK